MIAASYAVVFLCLCVAGYQQYAFESPRQAFSAKGYVQSQHPTIISQTKSRLTDIIDPGLDNIGQPKDGKNHPCYRVCKRGKRMTCYYRFLAEWYNSMSKACKGCPFNATDCGGPDCVPANGFGRPISVVNRKMPGPAVEVCKDDTVVVDVQNSLMASGTTIHWHGLMQRDTPFMDGTPYVTQCPIQPESTFRYEFAVPHAGTYFWHSHIGLQRGDGITGAIIIREPKIQDPHRWLYDFDRSEHVIFVTDWINNSSITLFTDHHHSSGDDRPEFILINGIGRFTVFEGNSSTNRTANMSAPVFEVEKGYRYRFRLINAEFLNCPVELSVDGHKITVIATDGTNLVPITASALVSYSGERYDFIITSTNKVGNYWIRVRGLFPCEELNVRQVAILRYKGAPEFEPAAPEWNFNITGLVLNAVNEGKEPHLTRTASQMRSLKGHDESLKTVPDQQIFISYEIRLKNNTHFNKSPYYGINQVASEFQLLSPQFNHISMKMPKSPLLVSRPSTEGFCNEGNIPANCTTEYCQCTHVIQLKFNSVIEIVIIDKGVFDVNHPFHLHGHSFRVVAQGTLTNSTVAQVRELDRLGNIVRNLKNAPVKDTTTVPEGGYTVIRFIADNPGYWLFHCHIDFHAEIGMALVFKVGEHENMTPVPVGFPQCGDFSVSDRFEGTTNYSTDVFVKNH